ncbi:MAG: preprotein translocase subunit YajC [Deltaproteobacteria bacterium]|nr:preprotein translocase subunit YajC [Deltaproteobacteria bacterium]
MGVPQKNKGNSQGGCGGDNPFMSFGLLAVMMVVFYFFLIRPQQKKQKEHQGLLNALMKGDKVVTSGGILGTIVSINDRIVTLEVGDKTKIKVLRHYIQGKQMDNKGADSNTDSGRKKE